MADEKQRLKPLFLIKPKTIRAKDIKRVERECGICIVECSDAESARFLDPPVAGADIDAQARAAMSLLRYIVAQTSNVNTTFYGSALIKHFVDMVIEGTKPANVPRVKSVQQK